jgi:teichuronic acid biosynthesis glycosyltransferase TuaC
MLDGRFEDQQSMLAPVQGNGDPFTFFTLAALEPNKNQSGLLDAFAMAFQDSDSVRLRVGGDGSLRRRLKAKARRLGIAGRVVFTGSLGRADVLREMKRCDAFVLPSLVETFGVVLIEALACGKPVVATRSGGPEDIVTARNGLLVPPANATALAEALQRARTQFDQYEPMHIRTDCLDRFGREAFVARLRAVYDRVLQYHLEHQGG